MTIALPDLPDWTKAQHQLWLIDCLCTFYNRILLHWWQLDDICINSQAEEHKHKVADAEKEQNSAQLSGILLINQSLDFVVCSSTLFDVLFDLESTNLDKFLTLFDTVTQDHSTSLTNTSVAAVYLCNVVLCSKRVWMSCQLTSLCSVCLTVENVILTWLVSRNVCSCWLNFNP